MPARNAQRILEPSARVQRVLAVGLLLAVEVLNAQIPPPVLMRLQADTRAVNAADTFQRGLFSSPRKESVSIWSSVLMREGLTDKMLTAWRFAFTPRLLDWTWLSLPPSLHFCYYVVRPIRLALKYS